jgi:hypothetical protein
VLRSATMVFRRSRSPSAKLSDTVEPKV